MATLLVGVVTSAVAQTTNLIFGYNKDWRYYQEGNTPTGSWTALAYANESSAPWGGGIGALGFPSDEDLLGLATVQTPLAQFIPGSTTTQVNTYYLRTHFNIAGNPNGVTLVTTNIVDDGAVVYVNGVEAGRLNMAAGAVTYSTLAPTRTAGDDFSQHNVDLLTFTPNNLLQGDNVIAVELHQVSATSSDAIWAMSLSAITPSALSITSQPQSQTIPVGSPVTFTVGISGGPARYQWQKNNANIGNATNASYTIASVAVGDAGSYRVIATNSVNSVTSSPPAVLTVGSDFNPPKLLSAIVQEVTSGTGTNTTLAYTNINITVDEQLALDTATNRNNYKIYNSSTEANVPVLGVVYNFPTIRLSVSTNSGWMYRSNYFVRASGLSDIRGNVMPLTDIGVSWRVTTNLMRMSQNWDFFNATFFFDPNYQFYSNYFKTNFVVDYNQGWGNGVGILWNDQDQTPDTCSTNNTLGADCGFQFDPQLFRRTFQAPPNLASSGILRLRYIIDDGAIFYLNGQELHRYNMPAGAITPATKSTANINPAVCVTNQFVNVTNRLFSGMNWMAGTVYQSTGDGEADTVFGFEMDYESLQTSPVPSRISIQRTGSVVQVTWSGTGYTLQSSTNPANPASWANVAGATSPANGTPNTFYRLSKN